MFGYVALFACVLAATSFVVQPLSDYKKACIGTRNGATFTSLEASERLLNYKTRYINCTYVEGNLEITHLYSNNTEYNLDFLSDIQEVTGYVLILLNAVTTLHLDRLRIIRGETLYNGQYSLYIAMNSFNDSSRTIGLRHLGLTSLYEISAGKVLIKHNAQLCHSNTVMWKDIMALSSTSDPELDVEPQQCDKCHSNCSRGFCWGDGPNMCQTLTKEHCAIQCNGRCYGDKPNECCNTECAAGCTGPSNQHCLACIHYIDNDRCVFDCEPLQKPNRRGKLIDNPDGKYKYGMQCVKNCPPNYIASREHSACLAECERGKHLGPDGQCIEDTGCTDNCQFKECKWEEEYIHAKNYHKLANCTKVHGGLRIVTVTFDGDRATKIGKMDVSQLNVLNKLEELYGFLIVNGVHRQKYNLEDLSFLSNLRSIHSYASVTNNALLEISATGLRSLGLRSLNKIGFGEIKIVGNRNLCFVQSINWTSLQDDGGAEPQIYGNSATCEDEGKTCSELCSGGCWGQGNDQCVSCRHFRLNRTTCVSSCSDYEDVYADHVTAQCRPCHSECEKGKAACSGPGRDQCSKCRHFIVNNTCVAHCTSKNYVVANRCYSCHPYCLPSAGCKGPGNGIGPDKCNKCLRVRLDQEQETVIECLDPKASECGIGYDSF